MTIDPVQQARVALQGEHYMRAYGEDALRDLLAHVETLERKLRAASIAKGHLQKRCERLTERIETLIDPRDLEALMGDGMDVALTAQRYADDDVEWNVSVFDAEGGLSESAHGATAAEAIRAAKEASRD